MLFQFNALCTSLLNKSCGLTVISCFLVLNTRLQFEPGALQHLIDFKGDLFLHFEAPEKSNVSSKLPLNREPQAKRVPGS